MFCVSCNCKELQRRKLSLLRCSSVVSLDIDSMNFFEFVVFVWKRNLCVIHWVCRNGEEPWLKIFAARMSGVGIVLTKMPSLGIHARWWSMLMSRFLCHEELPLEEHRSFDRQRCWRPSKADCRYRSTMPKGVVLLGTDVAFTSYLIRCRPKQELEIFEAETAVVHTGGLCDDLAMWSTVSGVSLFWCPSVDAPKPPIWFPAEGVLHKKSQLSEALMCTRSACQASACSTSEAAGEVLSVYESSLTSATADSKTFQCCMIVCLAYAVSWTFF